MMRHRARRQRSQIRHPYVTVAARACETMPMQARKPGNLRSNLATILLRAWLACLGLVAMPFAVGDARADSCSTVIPGASGEGYEGRYGGYDAAGLCHKRDISEAACRNLAGNLFYAFFADGGAGYTHCVFRYPSGSAGAGRSAPSGGPSPGNRQAQEDVSWAGKQFDEARDYYRAGKFENAVYYFAAAEGSYRRGGDTANAEVARRNKNLSICNANINSDDPDTLRLLLGQGQREPEITFPNADSVAAPASMQRLGACSEFAPEAQRIRDRIAAIEASKRRQADEAAARQRAAEAEAARQRAAEEEAAAQRRRAAEEQARQRAIAQEKREAAQQLERATQQAIANGGTKAAEAQGRFAANDPLNSGAQGFDAASKRAQIQQATGPTVDINSLRDSQRTCSDISGLGGGGSSNCSPSTGTNAQVKLNQAHGLVQAAQAARQTDPGTAATQLFKAAALLQAAGKVADAAAAFADALALGQRQVCAPAAPQEYWSANYNDYCASASTNCVERASAYYGMVCYAGRESESNPANHDDESKKICADALTILSPHAPDDTWLANQMARVRPPCNPKGKPMSVEELMRWNLAH